MKTQIGISEKNLKSVSHILVNVLSDSMVLLVKTKNYHWNVVAPNFSELHAFFENQYNEIATASDEIAERIRSLGHRSAGSMEEFLENATINEKNNTKTKAEAMLADLLESHETIIRNLRKAIDEVTNKYEDVGTGDFLTGLMENHEKMAWMTRSYLD